MQGYLQRVLPWSGRLTLPVSRDQSMLLMAAVNELFLGIDIYLAHKISGTIVPREWIPIIFGPLAGMALLAAGVAARKHRSKAELIAAAVFILSIGVGLLGAYYHFIRAIRPEGPPGTRVTLSLLIWAPPVIGPLMFSLVGLLGMSAVWPEYPAGSGRLLLGPGRTLQMPTSKTSAYCLMVSAGTLATLLSCVLDHARTSFENPWLWLPVVAGILGIVTAAVLGFTERPERGDILAYLLVMLLLMAVGAVGSLLHVLENLTAGGVLVPERFIRGAPFLAPLLFANMGMLGVLCLLDPEENVKP